MSIRNFIYVKKALGKGGKEIRTFKIRTMCFRADGEYERLVLENGLDEYGKIRDDPRITKLGKVLRRMWFDETPQLFNLLRGDLALVGVRPMTEKGWALHDPENKARALKYRPGLLGVSYSEDTEGFEGLQAVEGRYLDEKEISPIKTDREYFCKIIRRMLSGEARSR